MTSSKHEILRLIDTDLDFLIQVASPEISDKPGLKRTIREDEDFRTAPAACCRSAENQPGGIQREGKGILRTGCPAPIGPGSGRCIPGALRRFPIGQKTVEFHGRALSPRHARSVVRITLVPNAISLLAVLYSFRLCLFLTTNRFRPGAPFFSAHALFASGGLVLECHLHF
jgi:hypothetical protein